MRQQDIDRLSEILNLLLNMAEPIRSICLEAANLASEAQAILLAEEQSNMQS